MTARPIKVVVLGDSGIGKSCLLNVLARQEFTEILPPTSISDFIRLETTGPDGPVTLGLWDTAGQESQRSLASAYIRNSDVVLLCFALDKPDSFENVREWKDHAMELTPEARFLLIGTKQDLAEGGVSRETAGEFSEGIGCDNYLETSAKTGYGIAELEKILVNVGSSVPRVREIGIDLNVERPGKQCC
jgi:small GTP-binding protein